MVESRHAVLQVLAASPHDVETEVSVEDAWLLGPPDWTLAGKLRSGSSAGRALRF